MALADAVPYAVAHWALDEASGTRVDSVGSNDLTDNNTVPSVTGVIGDAASFAYANSEYLSIADNTALSFADESMTIRAWVRFTGVPADEQGTIVSKGTSSSGEYYLTWDYFTHNRFRFDMFGSSGFGDGVGVNADTLGAPSLDTWYLIHAWYNASTNEIGISVNAGTATTSTQAVGFYDGTGVFAIGSGYPHPGRYPTGYIDEVVILKGYCLDATERTEDYNSGTGVAFSDWAPVTVLPQRIYRPSRTAVHRAAFY